MSKDDVLGQIKMSPSMFYYVIVTAKLIYSMWSLVRDYSENDKIFRREKKYVEQ